MSRSDSFAERRTYRLVILSITAGVGLICLCETLYGLWLHSRFLIRDGLEWAYDVAIYAMAAASFGRGAWAERLSALGVAGVLGFAGAMTAVQIWWTYLDPPEVESFGITVSGTLIILEAWAVAAALVRFRGSTNPVIDATWLSARNDAVTSTLYAVVIMAARFAPMRWPQMGVDAVSVVLCWQAAWEIVVDVWRDLGSGPRDGTASGRGAHQPGSDEQCSSPS